MNKSLVLFLGGAVLGASIAAVALTDADADISVSSSGKQSTDEKIQKLAEITENLSVTAGALKDSAETLMSLAVPITPAKVAQKTPQLPQGGEVDATQVPMSINNNQTQMAPVAEPVQPTPMQIDRSTEIRSKLADAANNHAMPLGALIQEARDLTPEQRQQLTNEAMDMIKRGELLPEQFSRLPGT